MLIRIIFSGEVEIWDLADYQCRRVRLKWHGGSPLSCRSYCVSFSPDLSLILVNDTVYRLDTNADFAASIALRSSPNQLANNVNQGSTSMHDGPTFHAKFSTCNSFLLYLSTGSIDKQISPKVDLYQIINLETDVFTRISLPTSLDVSLLAYALAEWHPTLPILALITFQMAPMAETEEVSQIRACYSLNLDVPSAKWVEAQELTSERPQRKRHDLCRVCGTELITRRREMQHLASKCGSMLLALWHIDNASLSKHRPGNDWVLGSSARMHRSRLSIQTTSDHMSAARLDLDALGVQCRISQYRQSKGIFQAGND